MDLCRVWYLAAMRYFLGCLGVLIFCQASFGNETWNKGCLAVFGGQPNPFAARLWESLSEYPQIAAVASKRRLTVVSLARLVGANSDEIRGALLEGAAWLPRFNRIGECRALQKYRKYVEAFLNDHLLIFDSYFTDRTPPPLEKANAGFTIQRSKATVIRTMVLSIAELLDLALLWNRLGSKEKGRALEWMRENLEGESGPILTALLSSSKWSEDLLKSAKASTPMGLYTNPDRHEKVRNTTKAANYVRELLEIDSTLPWLKLTPEVPTWVPPGSQTVWELLGDLTDQTWEIWIRISGENDRVRRLIGLLHSHQNATLDEMERVTVAEMGLKSYTQPVLRHFLAENRDRLISIDVAVRGGHRLHSWVEILFPKHFNSYLILFFPKETKQKVLDIEDRVRFRYLLRFLEVAERYKQLNESEQESFKGWVTAQGDRPGWRLFADVVATLDQERLYGSAAKLIREQYLNPEAPNCPQAYRDLPGVLWEAIVELRSL